ncbi:MAG: ABC-2 family transporter protein [Anaerolineae bacterium]|nr:ABC-2 family transporter protein [Anaerolineae bacterium]
MMQRVYAEVRFAGHLVRLSLASNMEYRASFITQAVGMFINNGIYFVFWLLFFDRFKEIRGYQIEQIFLLFAIVALGYGLGHTFAGNAARLAWLIAQGRLDYYLTLPRPVLPHLLFSYMEPSAAGDLTCGLVWYVFTGRFDALSILLFLVCSVLAAVIFMSFRALSGCLSFFIGNASRWSSFLSNTLLTFSLYPMGLFQGVIRLILFTLVPAAFVGAVPVEVVETHSLTLLGGIAGAAAVSVVVLVLVFRLGLRRYESGSALNVNI